MVHNCLLVLCLTVSSVTASLGQGNGVYHSRMEAEQIDLYPVRVEELWWYAMIAVILKQQQYPTAHSLDLWSVQKGGVLADSSKLAEQGTDPRG